MPDDFPTIAEAARRIRDRELSPVELTERCLARIDQCDGAVHAFITVLRDSALRQARIAEREILSNGPRTPLHGIPLGLKDIFDTQGVATTAHSRQLAGRLPDRDARAVALLAEAGAVVVGKNATHEFAVGGPSFDLPWPPARNPWNLERFTGGSSSGTAAATAAGMCLGGLGSDTAGSVRGPAALCGVAGLKPTYGLVSCAGAIPLAPSLDHVGPLAWTVEDCAILLDVIANGPGGTGYRSGIGHDVRGLRIGVLRHVYEDERPVSADLHGAIESALAVFRGLGVEHRDVTVPSLADWHAAGFVILLSEAFAFHRDMLRDQPDKYGALFRDQIALGGLIRPDDVAQARQRRSKLVTALLASLNEVDAVLTVAQAGEAPPIDGMAKWGAFTQPSYNLPFNMAGCPALSVCCGLGPSGLPLAFQLAAKPFADSLVLRLGHAYERATAPRRRRPALVSPPARAA